MSDERDPEVLADLAFRKASEHDSSRSTEPPTYVTPRIRDQVPCRARCGNLTAWTEEAEVAFETFNAKLLADDQAPLDKTRIVFCPACVLEGRKLAATAAREASERLRDLIRELKASGDPEKETAMHDRLKRLGHPDVAGLVDALKSKRASGKAATNKDDVLRRRS